MVWGTKVCVSFGISSFMGRCIKHHIFEMFPINFFRISLGWYFHCLLKFVTTEPNWSTLNNYNTGRHIEPLTTTRHQGRCRSACCRWYAVEAATACHTLKRIASLADSKTLALHRISRRSTCKNKCIALQYYYKWIKREGRKRGEGGNPPIGWIGVRFSEEACGDWLSYVSNSWGLFVEEARGRFGIYCLIHIHLNTLQQVWSRLLDCCSNPSSRCHHRQSGQ